MATSTIPPGQGVIKGVAFIEDKSGGRVLGRYYICHPNVDLAVREIQEESEFVLDLPSFSEQSSPPKREPEEQTELELSMQKMHEEMLSIISRGPYPSVSSLASTLLELDTPTSIAGLKELTTLGEKLSAFEDLQKKLEAIPELKPMAKLKEMGKVLAKKSPESPIEDFLSSLRKAKLTAVRTAKILNMKGGETDPPAYTEIENAIEDIPKKLEGVIAVVAKLLIPANFVSHLSSKYLKASFPLLEKRYVLQGRAYRTILPFPLEGPTCLSSHRFFGLIEPYDKPYVEGIPVLAGQAVGVSPYGGTAAISRKQWVDFYDEARYEDKIHRGGDFLVEVEGRVFKIPNTHPKIIKPCIPQSPKTTGREFRPMGVLNYVTCVLDYMVSRFQGAKKALSLRFVCPWYTSHPNIVEVLSNVFSKHLFFMAHVMYEGVASATSLRENVFYYSNATGFPGLSSLYRSRRLVGLPPPAHSIYSKKAESLFYSHPKLPPGRVEIDETKNTYGGLFGLLEAVSAFSPPPPGVTLRNIADYVATSDKKAEGWAPRKRPTKRKVRGKN